MSCEGGHVSLSCNTEEDYEYEQFAKKHFKVDENELISSELLFCGLGIPCLYSFHHAKELKTEDLSKSSEEILKTVGTDPISRKAFEHFLRLLGSSLAHIAACFLPDSGILLSGRIVKQVIEEIKQDVHTPSTSILINSFISNRPLKSYMEELCIYFTPEDDLGMKGCLNFLKMMHVSK